MTWFVWVRGLNGPSPQIIPDGPDGRPFLDEGIRNYVLAQHKMKDGEDALLFRELAERYPAPKIVEESV